MVELERVARIEEGPLREGFVAHAEAWVDQTGVPVSGFREMKVPDDVLRGAGFDVPAGRRGRGAGAGRQRAKAVSVEEIKSYVLAQTDTFLLAVVMAGVGGSQATVRKPVDELIDAGEFSKLGPVPDYTQAEGEDLRRDIFKPDFGLGPLAADPVHVHVTVVLLMRGDGFGPASDPQVASRLEAGHAVPVELTPAVCSVARP